MIYFTEKDWNRVRNQLLEFTEKGLTDDEMAQQMGRCRGDIIYWRKKLGIKTNFKKVKDLRIKKELCILLNKESPWLCYSDLSMAQQISISLNRSISRQTIARIREELKIPPSAPSKKSQKTRQYIYFKNGRIQWSCFGNHITPRRK